MSGVCGSVQAAGALGQHPPGSLVTTNIFFVEPTSLSPWRTGRPLLTSPALVVAAAGPATSTPRGAAVKVFNIGGGRYWKSRQQPPRGPPLQHRWWLLPDLPPIAPRGPAIDVSSFGGGRCRTYRQHPQGARHRRLQLRWWPRRFLAWMVSDPGPSAPAPPEGPPLMFLSVDGVRSPTSSSGTFRGPAVDCRVKFKITEQDAEELASPAGSHPLPRWAPGPLSVP
jgi:hypothetical protein